MGESGDSQTLIKKDARNQDRPYPHCDIKPEQKPDYMQKQIYKPKKFNKQLDQLYSEINQVQYDNYKVSSSGSRYDTLNLIGSLNDGFNPDYNKFSQNVTVLKQTPNTPGGNYSNPIDNYKANLVNKTI